MARRRGTIDALGGAAGTALEGYQVPAYQGRIKLDANENPFSTPVEWPADFLQEWTRTCAALPLNRYPDPQGGTLKEELAKHLGVEPDWLLLGNGSDELIQLLVTTFGVSGSSVLLPVPTFSMYRIITLTHQRTPIEVPLDDHWDLDVQPMLRVMREEHPKLTFISYPNNHTGNCFSRDRLMVLLEETEGVVVVDEAYCDFSRQTVLPLLTGYDHLVVLRTLSKVGLAGLRIGVLIAQPDVVQVLSRVKLPYNVGSLSQALATLVLQHRGVVDRQVEVILRERQRLQKGLGHLPGVTPYPSAANFILLRVAQGGQVVFEALLRHGVVVRMFPDDALLKDCLRVTVGRPEENDAFLTAMGQITETGFPPNQGIRGVSHG